MTEAGFRAYLRPHLEAGRPFIAYWHPRGYGLCQTGLIPTRAWHYVLHQPGRPDKDYRTDYMRCRNMQMKTPGAYMEKVPVEGKPRQVSARTVAKWRVSLARPLCCHTARPLYRLQTPQHIRSAQAPQQRSE